MRQALALLFTFLLASSAYGQDVAAVPEAPSAIAGGMPLWSLTIPCRSSSTQWLTWDSSAAGFATKSSRILIPDGSRWVAHLNTQSLTSTTTGKCGWFGSPNIEIGAQGVASTQNDVTDSASAPLGTSGQGALFSLFPMGRTFGILKSNTTWEAPGYRKGVCSLPMLGSKTDAQSFTGATDRVRQTDLAVYGGCATDAECANVAGMPSGATCLLTPSSINSMLNSLANQGGRFARGLYMGCRCTGQALVEVEIWR